MANKSLTDLTALTTTADSDLVHVNRGGTDYKQEKIDFMNGNLSVAFSFSSLLTAQVDSMDLSKTCFGYLWNYSHVATSGVPIDSLCYIKAVTTNSNLYSVIEAWSATDPDGQHYIVCKNNGTWESSWTKCASKAEITSLNNSLTKCFNMSDLIGLNSSNPAIIPLGSVYGAGILLFRLAQGVGPLILKFTVNNGSLSVTYMDGTAFSNPALTFSFASQALKIQSTYSGTSTLVYIVTNG